jgi:excisionase family DNA binding protein
MMLLTVKDLAARFQVKEKTVYAWASQGKIPCMKIEGVIRFDSSQIEKWIQNRQVPIGPPCKSTKSGPKASAHARQGVDVLVERAKRAVYTSHGETRPVASPKRKETSHGAR